MATVAKHSIQPDASGLKRQNDEIVLKISKHNDMNENFVLFN